MELKPHPSTFLPRQRELHGTGNRKYISFGQTSASKGCSMAVSLLHNVKRNSVKRQRVQEPDGSSVAEAPLPRARKESLFRRASRTTPFSIQNKHNNAGRRGSSPDKYFLANIYRSLCTKQTFQATCHLCKFIAKKINRNSSWRGKITHKAWRQESCILSFA
jgi:hypothetical protein